MKPDQKKDGGEQNEPGDRKPSGEPKSGDESRNDQVADGKLPESKIGQLLQQMMGSAQWGLLPRKLREEMGSSAAKEFPREYRDIISKYYKRMAEVMSGK
jgi:hypothetical protein